MRKDKNKIGIVRKLWQQFVNAGKQLLHYQSNPG
nr:MAG TPA: heat shock transcription factor-like protein [Caudoviricetes sp.]